MADHSYLHAPEQFKTKEIYQETVKRERQEEPQQKLREFEPEFARQQIKTLQTTFSERYPEQIPKELKTVVGENAEQELRSAFLNGFHEKLKRSEDALERIDVQSILLEQMKELNNG